MIKYKKREIDIEISNLEIREEGDKKLIRGYASLFNNKSLPIWSGRREVVRPGAFKKTIKNGDVRALINHDSSMVLGRTKAETLSLIEDDKGLYVEIDPPDTTYSNNIIESISRGDIDQFSFGFNIIKDKEVKDEETDEIIHEINEVKLFEISVVTFPAYPDTKAKYRDTEEGKDINVLEDVLERKDMNENYSLTLGEKIDIKRLEKRIENLFTEDIIEEPNDLHSSKAEVEPSEDTQINARVDLVKELKEKNI